MLGGLAFIAARAPSLVPRDDVLQGVIAGSALFWSIGSGVLSGAIPDGLDTANANLDRPILPEQDPPQSPLKCRQSIIAYYRA